MQKLQFSSQQNQQMQKQDLDGCFNLPPKCSMESLGAIKYRQATGLLEPSLVFAKGWLNGQFKHRKLRWDPSKVEPGEISAI